jgi:hypothetical protein
MKKLLPGFILFITAFFAKANEPGEIHVYGYISHQIILDTYRSLDSRDGEIHYYPLRANFDEQGVDINKKMSLNMVEVQSRIGLRSTTNDFLGAQLTGVFEADFLGTEERFARMMRIRIASVKLRWENHELLIGQDYHPTFVLECYPNTESFAAAVPFHPLNRSPQIRYAFHPTETFNASLSLLSHGYHRSAGPADAMKNSGLPDIQLRLQFGDGKNLAYGLIAGYKFLTPRDETSAGLSTTQTIGSYNLQGYLKKVFNRVTFKGEAIYGQNLTSLIMIGGYGARGIEGELDMDSDYAYTNMNTISAWAEVETDLWPFSAGIFAGYTANLGADHNYVSLPGYSRNDDLSHVVRVSPRVGYHYRSLSFGFEWSVIAATYGATFDNRRRVTETEKPTINNHIIFATKYRF